MYTNIVTFYLFICPLNFSVCGCVIIMNVAIEILGMPSSFSYVPRASASLLVSSSESLLVDCSSCSASQVYSFCVLYLCPIVYLSLDVQLFFPSSLDLGISYHLLVLGSYIPIISIQ